jgi:hypothetical protein
MITAVSTYLIKEDEKHESIVNHGYHMPEKESHTGNKPNDVRIAS